MVIIENEKNKHKAKNMIFRSLHGTYKERLRNHVTTGGNMQDIVRKEKQRIPNRLWYLRNRENLLLKRKMRRIKEGCNDVAKMD